MPSAKAHRRVSSWMLLAAACGLWGSGASSWHGSVASADSILLARTPTSEQRVRQLRTIFAPPAEWISPAFDDSEWSLPPQSPSLVSGATLASQPSQKSASATAAGSLWMTAAPPSAAPAVALPQPPSSAPADGGLIFTDEERARAANQVSPESLPPPTGALTIAALLARRASALPFPGGPTLVIAALPIQGGAPGLAADAPVVPNCGGALYYRRHFDLDPSTSGLQGLTLRLRYTDGFAAYLNGTEIARRRIPEAAQTVATTHAADRGPVEPESYFLPLRPGLLQPTDNLLALEIHPKNLERCAKLDLELVGSDGPRVVRGPYIERLSDGALDLTLETDLPSRVELTYGKGAHRSERDRQILETGSPLTTHRLHLAGLRTGTVYHYQVAILGEPPTPQPTGDSLTQDAPAKTRSELPLVSFHTPPAAGRPLRLVLYGDSRSGHTVHAQVVQAILAEDPDLVLNTGDIVERGTEDGDWDRFFAVALPLVSKIPVYLAPGNHEYAIRRQGAAKLFSIYATLFQPQLLEPSEPPPPRRADTFRATEPQALPERGLLANVNRRSNHLPALPSLSAAKSAVSPDVLRGFYSLDIAGVHLVALDSNQFGRREQLDWLDADLARAEAKKARAIIAWTHDGPYSMGWHGDSAVAIRDVVPILERHHVSLMVSGHDHDYERGRRGNLNYVVTGGGGAELRPLRCGVPGKKRCKQKPAAFMNEHHYVSLEVLPGVMRLCPKRLDGTPLEECQLLRLTR